MQLVLVKKYNFYSSKWVEINCSRKTIKAFNYMKNILITQGIYKDLRNNYYTKLDIDWFHYAKMKFNLQPLPINFDLKYLKNYRFQGIIFSGEMIYII